MCIRDRITIANKLGEHVQLWTLDIDEKDLIALSEKYEGKGDSVLVDADDLPAEIKEFYK